MPDLWIVAEARSGAVTLAITPATGFGSVVLALVVTPATGFEKAPLLIDETTARARGGRILTILANEAQSATGVGASQATAGA